jgi:EAL domain-containing protein (putative c-di-GMP-specific phosphodiesterase class I)
VEQTALIIDIGEWVIRQVLAQESAWQRAGLELPVSVNIAARHLQIPGFAERLREMLQKQPDVPARCLELEVLETAALNDIEQARRVITACHGLGVRFALDDFGTGYSSLTYLRRLPADALKIDRSFVRDMLDDQEDLGIIEGVMSLARAFRRQVIAEGLEAPEQGVVLMRMGCDLAQGFGIAQPMPASDVPAWVGAYRPDPQWGLWANTNWDMSDFPLLVAQYDHLRWINGILHVISDKTPQLPREELHDQHHCRFGMWYGNGGRARYGHLAEFAEIDPIHTRLHQLGPEIMRLRDNGEAHRVPAHVAELHSLKDQILERLAALQHAAARMAKRG